MRNKNISLKDYKNTDNMFVYIQIDCEPGIDTNELLLDIETFRKQIVEKYEAKYRNLDLNL